MFHILPLLKPHRNILPFATLMLALTGCMELSLASKEKSFQGHDSMAIVPPRADILDLVADVGKAMKYDVSGLDRSTGAISLSSGIKTIEFIGIGKATSSQLDISTQEEGKKLDIRLMLIGNFGTGGQEAADKIITTFKSKLNERLSKRA